MSILCWQVLHKEDYCKTISENPSAKRSRAYIQEALFTLMEQIPFQEINVTMLCKQADLTRPTFYHHYQTTQDVLSDTYDALFDDFIRELTGKQGKTIEVLSRHFFDYWLAHIKILQLLTRNGLFSSLSDRFPQYLDTIFRHFNIATNMDVHERAYVYAFLGGGLSGMLRKWIDDAKMPDTSTMARFIISATSANV